MINIFKSLTPLMYGFHYIYGIRRHGIHSMTNFLFQDTLKICYLFVDTKIRDMRVGFHSPCYIYSNHFIFRSFSLKLFQTKHEIIWKTNLKYTIQRSIYRHINIGIDERQRECAFRILCFRRSIYINPKHVIAILNSISSHDGSLPFHPTMQVDPHIL